MLLRIEIRLALQTGQDLRDLAAQDGDLLLACGHVAARLVEALTADIAALQEALAALEGGVVISELVARQLELCHLDPVGSTARFDLRADTVALRRGMLKRNAIGLVIQAEQQLARLHGVVLADFHSEDLAGNLRGDCDLVGLHVGVLAGDVTLALDVEIGADQSGRGGHDDHQHQARQEPRKAAAAAWRRHRRLGRCFGLRRFGSVFGALVLISHHCLQPAPARSPGRPRTSLGGRRWPIAARSDCS